jgi:hypothetical protein
MKNLPCILSVSGIICLASATTAYCLGLAFPYGLVASHIMAFTTTTGVLAVLLRGDAPPSTRPASRSRTIAPKPDPAVPAVVHRPRATLRFTPQAVAGALPDDMTLFDLRNDPSTRSSI